MTIPTLTRIAEVLEPLVAAVEADFCDETTDAEAPDEDAVHAFGGKFSQITFGKIRAARQLLTEIQAGQGEVEDPRIAAVRELIGSGYPSVGKIDKCAHGRFGFEDCIGCYDEALIAVLDSTSLPSGGGD